MTELAERVFNKMRPIFHDKGVYRIYYKNKILKMWSGKYQWTTLAAAKNALRNHVHTILYDINPLQVHNTEDDVYNEIMKEIEIREC